MRLAALIAAFALAACANPRAEAEAEAIRAWAREQLLPVIDDAAWRPFVKQADGKTLPYRLHIPEGASAEAPAPLVVILHGAGERDDDNLIQLIHGAREILAYSETRAAAAFILVPQVARDQSWAQDQAGGLALAVIDELLADHPIDPSRIYLTGLSMGGFGTFDFVANRPRLFAAAVPICGGGDPGAAASLAGTPFWIFHGALDELVPVQRSRDMAAAILAAGGAARYTEYPDLNHNSWDATYGDDAVLDWMFAQRRD